MLYQKKVFKISMLLILILGLFSPLISYAETVETEDNQSINDNEIQVQGANDSSTGANPDDGTPGIQYNEDYTAITGYIGTATDVVIPYGITDINVRAFYMKELTSVIIPNSVTTINSWSFAYNQLTSVTIPNSVTSLKDGAFNGNQLTSVSIPESITSIEAYVFVGNQLTSVTIPESVTSIGIGAFGNNQLTSIDIPDSVTTIKNGAFTNNQLMSVTIPDSVTNIDVGTFAYNQLTSITIPDSVTNIGVQAFAYNQLTSVTIPDSVTNIGVQAFAYNQLTSITIPETVTDIGNNIAIEQNSITTKVRQSSYTPAELGISTFYREDKAVSLVSQTIGISFDGTNLQIDPSFVGDEFVVEWSSWDGQHTGTLTVDLTEPIIVTGTINYQDELGNFLLVSKDVSSQVGSTFSWLTPENITGYQVDYSKSTMVSNSDNGTEQITLTNLMTTSNSSTIEELINYLSSIKIEDGIFSTTINYVYTKDPVKAADVTVKYIDEDGKSISDDMLLTGNFGDTFTTEKLTIEGYTFKEVQGNVTGIFTDQEQTVTYIYTKNSNSNNSDQNKIETSNSNTKSNDDKQLPMTNSINEPFIALIGILFILGMLFIINIKKESHDK